MPGEDVEEVPFGGLEFVDGFGEAERWGAECDARFADDFGDGAVLFLLVEPLVGVDPHALDVLLIY